MSLLSMVTSSRHRGTRIRAYLGNLFDQIRGTNLEPAKEKIDRLLIPITTY